MIPYRRHFSETDPEVCTLSFDRSGFCVERPSLAELVRCMRSSASQLAGRPVGRMLE